MDIFSHGLWGGIAFGRRNRKSFWLAFLFGILPDLLAFGPFVLMTFLGYYPSRNWGEPPHAEVLPSYIYNTYNYTHSLVIFAVVYALIYLIRRKHFWELFAWPLHILVDLPTHSTAFFPTPFLYPIADVEVNGRSWGSPEIFIPNVVALIVIYVYYFLIRPRMRAKRLGQNQGK
jgi:hypothetical protein